MQNYLKRLGMGLGSALFSLILLGGLAAPAVAARPALLTPTTVPTALSSVNVIYLGETHDHPADHQAQLAIIQALQPTRPAIGLEMFQRPYQAGLDRYLAGTITETQLLEQSQFVKRWGFPWAHYAPILRFAKAQHLPVIALNTPTEVTRKVARQGLNALSAADRRFIPPVSAIQLEPPAYRQMMQEIFASMHQGKGNSDRFEKFFAAQVLWDETMAERISQFLQDHPKTPMIVLAGQGHIVHGYGIPSRVARRLQNHPTFRSGFKQALVLLNPTPELVDSPRQPPIADYVWQSIVTP